MLVGAMVASLAACGGSSGSGTAAPATGDSTAAAPAVTSGGEHTLTVSAWDHNFNIPALLAAEEDYRTNVDPEFKLEINEVSGSSDVETAQTLSCSRITTSRDMSLIIRTHGYRLKAQTLTGLTSERKNFPTV